MDSPSLEQVLVDWLLDTFNITAEYQTRDRVITWRGYVLIAFPHGALYVVRCKDAAICWNPQIYNIGDPNIFTRLKEEIEICITHVRKQTDYLNPMAMAKWD